MGTSAGPSLQGIGRGGASNLVLEMDAHDAKSYPGEPTSNIFSNPNNWTGSDWNVSSGTVANNAAEGPNGGSAGSITATGADPYIYSNLVHSVATGGLTFSCWVKGVGSSVGKSGDIRINFAGTATGSATTVNYTLTGLWQRVSISGTVTGAGTIKVGIEPPNSAAVGDVVYLADAQLEQKGYATPFVREGKGGTGTYNARPASINLMIHGDVGTGTSFEDSSPSKHTITTSGNTTHSDAQSKFSGGSVYFDGTGDYLTIADHADWTFGTGDFTIDLWIYPTTIGSGGNKNYVGTNPNQYLTFASNNSGGLLFYSGNGTWVSVPAATSNVVVNDAWQHVAVSRVSGTVYLFHNGVLMTSRSQADSIDPPNIEIGAYGGGASDLFVGYMDEVRITKGTALWTAAFTPPTRRNLSAPVVDRSGSDNGGNFATTDMTDVATYRVGEVIRPIDSAVWDFDGTDDVIDLGNINYNGLTGLTVATWVYSSNFAANDSFLSSWGDNSNSNYAWLLFASQWVSTKIDWLISTNGTSYTRCAGTLGLTNNLWYHVVGTWNSSGAMVLYVNGALDGTATGPTSIMNNDFNTFIGCDSDGSSEAKVRFFGGKMGNATIWKTTLNAAQVEQNFNQQRSRFGV